MTSLPPLHEPIPELPQPPPPRFSPYLVALLGFALGSLLFFALRFVGQALLPGRCEGHTVLALLSPLLLGPGGIALATQQLKKTGQAALGVGLVVSSLFPALFFGVRDISALRTEGCAGGYVVFGTPSGGRLPELSLRPGEAARVTVRPGGFQKELGPVALKVSALPGVLSAQLSPTTLQPNATGALLLRAATTAAAQQYTVEVVAAQGERQSSGQLTVTVRPH